MYIIDTSVWIDFFNGKLSDLLKNQVISYIENDEIYFNGIILSELLIGTKNTNEKNFIQNNFDGFIYLPFELDDFKRLSKYGNKFLRKGITIPLTDLLIFYHTVENNLTLLTKDKHFKLIQKTKKFELWFVD